MNNPYYEKNGVLLWWGDCLNVLDQLEPNSVDSIITDPPYSLSSIKKRFSKTSLNDDNKTSKNARDRSTPHARLSKGFMGKIWDSEIAFNPEVWEKCLRVAKPGCILMAMGGSRTSHRLACAIEDAGWEIRDEIKYFYDVSQQLTSFLNSLNDEQLSAYLELHYPSSELAWVYGQGIGLGHNVSKGIDKAKGKEREVIEEVSKLQSFGYESNTVYGGDVNREGKMSITAPVTELAKLFEGYNSRLKPAHENILCYRKPLNYVPNYDIITETNILLGSMICLLLLSVKDAKKVLKLNQIDLNEVESVFVAMLAGLLVGKKSGELSEKMGMFNSPETVLMCLSIAELWNNILDVLLDQGNMFTTKTGIEVTTTLKILNSLILPIIPEYIIKDVCQVNGLHSHVINVEKNLNEEKLNMKDIPIHIAAAFASWKTSENGTLANIAVQRLIAIIPSVNSVLKNVQQDIIMLYDQIKSLSNVSDAEKNTEQQKVDQLSTVEENVTSQLLETRITPSVENIIVAMKPIEKTYAYNAEKWGISGFNIDGSRIETENNFGGGKYMSSSDGNSMGKVPRHYEKDGFKKSLKGRYPANIIHDDSDEVNKEFDKAGVNKSTGGLTKEFAKNHRVYGKPGKSKLRKNAGGLGDSGSVSRYFQSCPSDIEPARFLYTPKASKKERGTGNSHPTQKPIALMKYLCKLTKTPTGGIVLDPFAGSGTTLLAAREEGREAIGIELEKEYCEIIVKRLQGREDVSPIKDEEKEEETETNSFIDSILYD